MLEVADIFREAGGVYRERFGDRMLPSHHRAMRDIEQCRTAALGGHLYVCDHCDESQYSYHSCRNRHCPKCQQDRAEAWVRAQRQRLLPCSYSLLTFTVPDALRPVARSHQKQVYGLLLSCAAQAIQKLARDPRYLGAKPGMMAVLHTWTRDLLYHPHAHFLVTAGGLSTDGQRWLHPKHPRFFLPGRVLSVLFRAKLRDALKKADLYNRAPKRVWKQKWVVHVQPAGRGEETLEYLGRYLFRTAMANSRLTRFENGRVTFRFREGGSGAIRQCSLSAQEFIRRFLQHVLPRGFTKVRHYGCFSPSCGEKLEQARRLLGAEIPPGALAQGPISASEIAEPAVQRETNAGSQDRRCPFCKTGRMRIVATLPKAPRRAFGARAPPGALR